MKEGKYNSKIIRGQVFPVGTEMYSRPLYKWHQEYNLVTHVQKSEIQTATGTEKVDQANGKPILGQD